MADTQKENAAPTSRAARASKRAARGVLRWGETLESLFLLSPDCPAWSCGTSALMRNLATRGLI